VLALDGDPMMRQLIAGSVRRKLVLVVLAALV
jgi:hypothetical protein